MPRTWINLDSAKPLRYMKEAIYAGQFNKDGDEFEVSNEMLSRLADSVQELRAAGIEIPLANGHDDWINAANRLGDIVGASVLTNDKGIPALYLDVAFADEASRDMALRAEVSIGYLREFLDGKGVMHESVLRHVAATSGAVIPALEDWAALAASFTNKDTSMKTIFEKLGVMDEQAALDAITGLQAKDLELSELQSKLTTGAVVAKAAATSIPPLVIRTVRDAREQQLDALVTKGEISPAVKSELVLAFANDKQVSLELSEGSNGESFEQILKIAKLASKSQPVAPSGRSSAPANGEVELAHAGAGNTYVHRFQKWAEAQKKSPQN